MLLVVVEVRVDGEVGQTDGKVLDRRQTETVHTVLAQVSHVPLTQPHQVHRVVFILTINSITISITMIMIMIRGGPFKYKLIININYLHSSGQRSVHSEC